MSFDKINLLERCNQIFICSICCDSKSNGQCKTFSTSTISLFLEHLRCLHSSVPDFECIYCCCHIASANLVSHIQNHFVMNDIVSINCSSCHQSIGQNCQSIISHMEFEHGGDFLVCPNCHGVFPSLADLRSHLLTSQINMFHCPVSKCIVKSHSKAAILFHLSNKHSGSRLVRTSRQYACSERINQNRHCSCSGTPHHTPELPANTETVLTNEDHLIDLPYSGRVLAKLSTGLDERLQGDLCQKMDQYSRFKVRLEVVDGQKQFVCSTCQYRSVHSLADVRKHILGCHCSVSTSYTRLCLRASRMDTNNFTLFSDRKLISFANEKLKRAENGSTWDGNCDFSGLQLLDDSEQDSASNPDSVIRAGKRHSVSVSASVGQESNNKKIKLKQRQMHGTKMRSDSPVPEVGPPLERNENFDRVINLNYSWPVLERLVLGQCPDRYLPILQQKMDVYSQHRILLTRRNGKRYFLCSHCPNCSPHGMNDIRKHILGVHARLPERFKSAAMYCSRMNRDNYGLLSDDELLKKNQDMVRWRSTPVHNGQDDLGMEPLLPMDHQEPLSESSSPTIEDHRSQSVKAPSYNIFLSGGADPGSPTSMTEPITVSRTHQHYSHMPLQSIFSGITAIDTHLATVASQLGTSYHHLATNDNTLATSLRSLVTGKNIPAMDHLSMATSHNTLATSTRATVTDQHPSVTNHSTVATSHKTPTATTTTNKYLATDHHPLTTTIPIAPRPSNGHLTKDSLSKIKDECSTVLNNGTKGCSRRSLVLKSRNSSHNI